MPQNARALVRWPQRVSLTSEPAPPRTPTACSSAVTPAIMRPVKLTAQLAKIVGSEVSTRPNVTKQLCVAFKMFLSPCRASAPSRSMF